MSDRGYLGISELGQCERRVFYAHRREFDEFCVEEPAARRKMRLGTLGEQVIAEERGDQLSGRQTEVRFGPALGHIDGYLVGFPPELWEAKLTTVGSIRKWQREGLPRYYLWQVNPYMKALSEGLSQEVTICRLDAMDRTSADIVTLTIPRQDDVVAAALARAERLARAIEHGPLPDREFECDSIECRYCPFRAHCWQGTLELEGVESGPDIVDGEGWEGFAEAIETYTTGAELAASGTVLKESAKEEITEAILSHNVKGAAASGYRAIVSHMWQERFDSKEFRAAHPELWAQFKKSYEITRLDVRKIL